MMLCSEASLSPSVTLASDSAVAFLSLPVILLPGAMFLRPGRNHHQRTRLVRKRLDIGAELDVLGRSLEAGGGQLNIQRHRLAGASLLFGRVGSQQVLGENEIKDREGKTKWQSQREPSLPRVVRYFHFVCRLYRLSQFRDWRQVRLPMRRRRRALRYSTGSCPLGPTW